MKSHCHKNRRSGNISHPTDIDTRGLPVIIDEPEERGGTNKGVLPTETMISSLVG